MPLRVDIATGETRLYREDVRLPGYIPLLIGRVYRSGREENGPFGYGWRLNLDLSLRVEPERLVVAPETPHETVFSRVDEGMQARHATGMLVQHFASEYVVTPAPDRRLVFAKKNARNKVVLPLSRIEDGGENEVHFYFDRDRLVGIVDTVGRQIRFEYQGGTVQRIRLENEGASILRTFQYNGKSDLVRETDEDGYSTSFGYHDHLMIEYTNRCGGTQYAQYDDDRRCCALWYGDGSHGRRFAYDDARSSARVVGATGLQTLYRYAPTGQVIERIDPADRSQNYYYDDTQQLVGFSDEHETVQTFQHLDVDEGLLTSVDAEERTAFLEIDDDLRLQTVTDAQDRQAGLVYDGHDRPIGLQTETGAEWRFERDDRGAVTRLCSPSGREVQFRRGADSETLKVEDGSGQVLEDHFDEHGRLVERTDALGRRFQWRYDANGRLKSVQVASQSVEFGYDPEGHVTRVREASGRESAFTYDTFGRLQEWDGTRGTFQIEYDGTGHVRAIRDGNGHSFQFEVDGYGRVTRVLYPGGREMIAETSDDGTLVVVDVEAGRTETQFNRAGDPVRWHRPDRPARHCTYGPSGTLLSAERGGDSFSFEYRDDGLLRGAETPSGDLTLHYDADGQLDAIDLNGTSVVQCQRDARGRPTILEARGRRYQIAFDSGNRLQSIRSGDQTWTFGYDALDHLTGAQGLGLDLIPEEGRARVSLSERSVKSDPRAEISIHVTRNGMALSARMEDMCVPLWGRGSYVRPVLPMSGALRAATIIRGADPLHEMLALSPSFDRHGEWQNLIQEGIRWDYTEIPSASEVRQPSWTNLDRFYLARSYYAMGFPALEAGESFGNRPGPERSPDMWTTGTHVAGTLRGPIWKGRWAGCHLHHPALGMTPGPKSPFDLLRTLTQTTSWR